MRISPLRPLLVCSLLVAACSCPHGATDAASDARVDRPVDSRAISDALDDDGASLAEAGTMDAAQGDAREEDSAVEDRPNVGDSARDTAIVDSAVDAPASTDASADSGACGATCAGSCVDIGRDRNHCGGCGRRCGEFEECVAGACQLDCRGNTLCGGLCRDLSRDVLHCGACGAACPTADNGVSSCVAGACVVRCNQGYSLSAGTCVRSPTMEARPIAPMSGSVVSSQRPTLRWALPAGATGARVELCTSRACTSVIESIDTSGVEAVRPTMPLARGVVFWRVRAMFGATIAASPAPVWQFTVRAASAPIDTAWGAGHDWNGDRFDDVAVTSAMAGRLFVFNGAATATSSAPNASAAGPVSPGYFGLHAASAGDVNGDGFSDLLVQRYGPPTEYWIFFGSAAGIAATPSQTIVDLASDVSSTAHFAWSAGDVNGDGYGDVVASGAGLAKVFYGSAIGLSDRADLTLFGPAPGAFMFGWPPNDAFGAAVAAGDSNGDGYADIAVSTLHGVQIHRGSAAGVSATPSQTIDVEPSVVRGGGDCNNDGYSDLLVLTVNPSITARLYLGGPSGFASSPSHTITVTPSGSFTWTGAIARDTNADGFDDVVLTLASSAGNSTTVHRGTATGLSVTAAQTIAPPLTVRSWGRPTIGAGDVDGDGFDDVLIGAPGSSVVHLYRGGPSTLPATPSLVINAPAGVAGFGSAVASRLDATPQRRSRLHLLDRRNAYESLLFFAAHPHASHFVL